MITGERDTIGQKGAALLYGQQGDPLRTGPENGTAMYAAMANLKHELRTMLNAIIGFSEILTEHMGKSEGGARPAADLADVNWTGKRILEVINDFLDPIKTGPTLSKPRLQKIWDLLHLRLKTDLSHLVSQGEKLLENARKTERQSLVDDLQVICSSAKQLKAVVERMASPSRDGEDASEDPAAKPDNAEAVRKTAEVIGSLEKLSPSQEAPRGLILVVDDNEADRVLLCNYLDRDGHTVMAVKDGRRALDLLAAHEFDMVIVDVFMPSMNGYQVLGEMRNSGRIQKIPVIMISALDDTDGAVRCIEMGAEEYLIKPFDRNLLSARVKGCLQKKRERDRTARELSADLDNKSSQLQETAEELGESRRKIELLEDNTARIQSAVRQEIEKISRVSIFDILMILGCGLILGLVFNAANAGGVRLMPRSWSAEPPASIALDTAKAKLDSKSALFVDARPSGYFQQGHIPGAINLSNDLFDFIYMMKFSGTEPETEIIIYGRDISRHYDEETASRLGTRGHHNISIMTEDLPGWQKMGYPIEK
jgi:DNA-binding response OmpR family regulator/rhodanese-related sulfurtransferase